MYAKKQSKNHLPQPSKKTSNSMKPLFTIFNLISIFFIFQIKLKIIPLFPSCLKSDISTNINDLIYNLSLGIIISSIFYIIVVYIPDYKKRKSTLSIIEPRLNTIIEQMIQSIYYLIDKRLRLTNPSFENLSEVDFLSITNLDKRKMDFKYEIFGNNFEWIKFSSGEVLELEHFSNHRDLVIKKIDEILSMPTIIYIDSELIEVLAKLRDCWFFSGIESMNSYNAISVQNFNKGVYDYYSLFLRLKKFGNPHKFRVT